MTQISSSQVVAANVPPPPDADPQFHQYLTFVLGTETFAIGILSIKEIIEYSSLTDVPMMPPYVRGVINLRGAVVPVIDLAVRFNRAPAPVTKRTCIVIIEIMVGEERQVIGIVVDAVNEVLDIPAADIEPPPAFGTGIRTDFILGMGKVHGKFVIVLNVNHVLAFDELASLAVPAA
jgi:purine-binding chemotaxis protein CheW